MCFWQQEGKAEAAGESKKLQILRKRALASKGPQKHSTGNFLGARFSLNPLRVLCLVGGGVERGVQYVCESENVRCSFMSSSLWPRGLLQPTIIAGSSVHGILQARILEWVAIPFFLTQGSNPGLLHCRQILYRLSHCEGRRVEGINKKKVKRGKESFLPLSRLSQISASPSESCQEEIKAGNKVPFF